MDIYFSNLERTKVYKLPCLPSAFPEITAGSKNEEFESYSDGIYNLIGNSTLRTFNIDCWLPEYANKYSWVKNQIDPYLLINLWEYSRINKLPIRCILVRGANKNNISPIILDWMVTIETYTQQIDEFKDIHYKIDLKEYRSLTSSSDTTSITEVILTTQSVLNKLSELFN